MQRECWSWDQHFATTIVKWIRQESPMEAKFRRKHEERDICMGSECLHSDCLLAVKEKVVNCVMKKLDILTEWPLRGGLTSCNSDATPENTSHM